MTDANYHLRVHKGLADVCFVRKHGIIKSIGEGDDCVVINLVLLVDADDVFGASFEEDAANKLRVARRNENEVELGTSSVDQFLQLCAADQLTITFVSLKKQKIALILGHFVVVADCVEGVEDAMA